MRNKLIPHGLAACFSNERCLCNVCVIEILYSDSIFSVQSLNVDLPT